ncbi:prepilin peptidase [Pelagibius sp. Alg239-R121]|uniref:prepilin peptidase n=1 Tax=Pelagibius sp. Alg239-R121 TaxID=2993448 RepID=UPI0024A6DBBD|nr:prepilin peptidase [Pelagibius sp. Alg239-R121]
MTLQNIFLLIFAPFIGSFLGLLIMRLPSGRGVIFGRSQCDCCGTTLYARHLFPLLSWLLLRRRCRHCGVAIDWLALVPRRHSFAW